MLNYYRSLPDYISTTQLIDLFEEFLSINSSDNFDKAIALESLLELSDRQWHTYELLDGDLKNKIESWVILNFNKDSIHDIDLISSITGRLGLVKVYLQLKKLLNGDVNNETKKVIQETIAELDGHVDDPYFGMK